MESIGIGMPAELIERIDKERAREGVRTGNTPSRSEWFRRMARKELDGETCEAEVPAEA